MKRIATIGFFDGVHRGHRYLFACLRAEGARRGLTPLIVTFDCHPRSVLADDYRPQLLTGPRERIALLRQQGEVLVLSFEQIHGLSAAEFVRFLHDKHGVEALVMGYDHRFGSDRMSYRDMMASAAGYTLPDVQLIPGDELHEDEYHVSSTEIRRALEHGSIVLVNEMLGRDYTLAGTVVHGNAIGRTMGYPTANIRPDDAQQMIPRSGVYEVMVKGRTAEGELQETKAVCNIGTNPTVGNTTQTIEVHLPGLHADLYDAHLCIAFRRFMRAEKRFDNIGSLQKQIAEDISNL